MVEHIERNCLEVVGATLTSQKFRCPKKQKEVHLLEVVHTKQADPHRGAATG